MKQSYKAVFLIVLAAALGGGVGALSKIAMQEISPLTFTLLRFVLGAAILIPLCVSGRIRFRNVNWKKIIPISLLCTANVTLFIFGIQKTTATVGAMLYAAVPLIAAIFSYLLLKEKISSKKILGIVIGFLGVIFIIVLPAIGEGSNLTGDLIGNLIIMGAVFSFALYSVLSKQLQTEYQPIELTSYFILTTVVVQILLVPFDSGFNPAAWHNLSLAAMLSIVYAGILGTGIFYLIYQNAIKISTPIIASMILYIQPIAAFIWGALLLGERLTPGFVVGAILAFIGVALVTTPEKSVV